MAEFSTSPTSTVLERQLFVRHTALWTGIPLIKQILCEGGIDVRNNTTKSYPAVRPL
jgi:hypothetical protein